MVVRSERDTATMARMNTSIITRPIITPAVESMPNTLHVVAGAVSEIGPGGTPCAMVARAVTASVDTLVSKLRVFIGLPLNNRVLPVWLSRTPGCADVKVS